MNLERLEKRIALDADGLDVYGPPIPDHLDYTPPIVLMPIGYVSEVQLPEVLPVPADTGLGYNRSATSFSGDVYDPAFAAMAQDGVVTLREARDWLSDMNHTQGGYNRFEIPMAKSEVNDPANLEVFTPRSFYLLTQVVNSPDFEYNDLEFVNIQNKTDELFWLLSERSV